MTKDELRVKVNESLEKHKQSIGYKLDKENELAFIIGYLDGVKDSINAKYNVVYSGITAQDLFELLVESVNNKIFKK